MQIGLETHIDENNVIVEGLVGDFVELEIESSEESNLKDLCEAFSLGPECETFLNEALCTPEVKPVRLWIKGKPSFALLVEDMTHAAELLLPIKSLSYTIRKRKNIWPSLDDIVYEKLEAQFGKAIFVVNGKYISPETTLTYEFSHKGSFTRYTTPTMEGTNVVDYSPENAVVDGRDSGFRFNLPISEQTFVSNIHEWGHLIDLFIVGEKVPATSLFYLQASMANFMQDERLKPHMLETLISVKSAEIRANSWANWFASKLGIADFDIFVDPLNHASLAFYDLMLAPQLAIEQRPELFIFRETYDRVVAWKSIFNQILTQIEWFTNTYTSEDSCYLEDLDIEIQTGRNPSTGNVLKVTRDDTELLVSSHVVGDPDSGGTQIHIKLRKGEQTKAISFGLNPGQVDQTDNTFLVDMALANLKDLRELLTNVCG